MENVEKIQKLFSGNLREDERAKLFSEIEKDPAAREEYKKMKAAWAVLSAGQKMSDYRIEGAYEKLHEQIKNTRHSFGTVLFSVFKYAAVIVSVAAITSLFFISKEQKERSALKYTSVVAARGQMSKIVLPDSSEVWLNSGTMLTYNNNYAIDNRNLQLKGEAFFHIKKNTALPLFVSCNELKVKVYGTKFNVSSYEGDEKIKVTLEEGSVELLHSDIASFSYFLKPGEMASYDIGKKDVVVSQVNVNEKKSWLNGMLIFVNTPMKEVIRKLELKFDVEIRVEDQNVYKSIFNATFSDEKLSDILDYIEYSCPIKYTVCINQKDEKKRIRLFRK